MEIILTKLAQIYCWDLNKNLLDYGDLNPIFKITGEFRILEIGMSAPMS